MNTKGELLNMSNEQLFNVLESVKKVTNENDVLIALILCVSAIIIVGIVCLTLYVLRSRRENRTIKNVIVDLLKNDKKVIERIREVAENQ